MKFSIFTAEKKSLYIAWASFRYVCCWQVTGRVSRTDLSWLTDGIYGQLMNAGCSCFLGFSPNHLELIIGINGKSYSEDMNLSALENIFKN